MIRMGVICPSEIAFRRFMPSLKKSSDFQFIGLGVSTITERFGENIPSADVVNRVLAEEHSKVQKFIDTYGGKIFNGYEAIVTSNEIDALYVPLPPALHFKWARLALDGGKHVLLEKPATTSSAATKELIDLAAEKGLALHENYMFVFHNQFTAINDLVANGEVGDVRLYRVAFGFPRRDANDFRYNKLLGGGALIDIGGYTIKYATMLLGETARIAYAQMNYIEEFDVDIYGSATLINDKGTTVQIAYGMDNNYKCELEIWGSKGFLTTGRVFTAPVGFVPEMTIRKGNVDEVRKLPADDTFNKSIIKFYDCINHDETRIENYRAIVKQAELMDEFLRLAGNKVKGSSQSIK